MVFNLITSIVLLALAVWLVVVVHQNRELRAELAKTFRQKQDLFTEVKQLRAEVRRLKTNLNRRKGRKEYE